MRLYFFATAAAAAVAVWVPGRALATDPDPWNAIKWTTDATGSFSPTVVESVDGLNFQGGECLDVAGHAVVVHEPGGSRVGCGTLGQDLWIGVELWVHSDGVSNSTLTVPGYGIDSSIVAKAGVTNLTSDQTAYNAHGHVVVIHAPNGTRVGCAESVGVGGSPLTVNAYPGWNHAAPSGTVSVTTGACANGNGTCLHMTPDLDMSAFCDSLGYCGPIHIHTGTSCSNASTVGGHLYRDDVAVIQEYPGYDTSASNSFVVRGIASVSNEVGHISFTADLVNAKGFSASTTGGIHIHTGAASSAGGSACLVAGDVGGHMYEMSYTPLTLPTDSSIDPWSNVVWSVGATGCFNPQIVQQPVPSVTYSTDTSVDSNVYGRVVVVHNENGARIGCGMLNYDAWNVVKYVSDANGDSTLVQEGSVFGFEFGSTTGKYMDASGRVVVAHNEAGSRVGCGCCVGDAEIAMNSYPGTTSSIGGSVTVTYAGDGVLTMSTNMTGLESSVTGGLHIHTGTSCADASTVGGHLYRVDGAQMQVYPGYTGTQRVYGFADVASNGTDGILFGTSFVNGEGTAALPASSTGGVHIHVGRYCNDSSTVGGHFWYDPPTTTTTTTTTTSVSAIDAGIRSTMQIATVLCVMVVNCLLW